MINNKDRRVVAIIKETNGGADALFGWQFAVSFYCGIVP
jgi:hypothetical protein